MAGELRLGTESTILAVNLRYGHARSDRQAEDERTVSSPCLN